MTADVIVIGGGVIGKTISYTLAEHGVAVTCVGSSYAAPGTASTAAGAMLGVLGEVTATAASPMDETELGFRAAAGRRYPDFAARLAETSGVPIPLGMGTFVVGTTVNEADLDNLAAIRMAARNQGLPCEQVDHRNVPGLRPARRHEPLGVLHLAQEGFLDSWQLMESLQVALEKLPTASLVTADATAVEVEHGRVTGVRLRDGSFLSAGHVVLANGVGAQPLLDQLGDLPGTLPRLLPGKGVSLVLDRVDDDFPQVIRTPNRDFACGSHVVPRGGGAVYLGATNRVSSTPGSGAEVTPGEVHSLMHSLMHEINVRFRTASLASQRYGLRPLTSDGYPLIGATALAGLSIATGTYRNGILMAPAVGEIIAAVICGDQPSLINPFAPDAGFRSANAAPEVTDILDEGLRHLVSFLLEPGGHMPYDRYRELHTFLTHLARLALANDAQAESMREEIRRMFRDHPVPEMLPQLFYRLAAQQPVQQP
ncbi:FAD-dependent oxidoreductase [Streptomyces cellostaticus]|uniref:FAD-dependent oxidoreductase n=1 Tax=Streptomyces cellostaticus TaxID=67285 RepID=UPI0020271ACE|nr:FAD-dependent oxidoreductase [Streptomyces cellostaticus]